MLHVRRAADRGAADYNWLKTAYTFSFNNYHDPNYMGFRDLRVVNEDVVAASRGFAKHPHRDMEIITYVLSGRSSIATTWATSRFSRRASCNG